MTGVFWGISDDIRYTDLSADRIIWAYYVDSEMLGGVIPTTIKCEQLPNVYKSVEDFNTAYDYCMDLSHQIIELYTPVFNEIHGCNFKSNEWKLMLLRYTSEFVSTMYDKYLNMKVAEERVEDFYIVSDPEFEVSSENLDFQRQLFDSKLNLVLMAELMLSYGHRVVDVNGKNITSLSCRSAETGTCKKVPKKSRLSDLVCWRKCKTLTTLGSYMIASKYAAFLTLGRVRDDFEKHYSVSGTCRIDEGKRSKLCLDTGSNNDFFDLVARLFGKYLPQSYVEYFDDLSLIAEESYPPTVTRLIDSNKFYSDEAFKRYLMDRKSKHCIISGVNHGVDSVLRNMLENDIFDTYYSGVKLKGWVHMPTSKLLMYKRIRCKSGKGILLTDQLYPKYLYNYYGGGKMDIKSMLNNERVFLSHLSTETKRRMICRLFPDDWGWNWKQRLQSSVSDLFFDDRKVGFYQRLIESSLHIATGFETTWLEAIYVGIPTIIIFPSHMISHRDDEKDIIDMMKEVDIYIPDPIRAAKVVESISGREVEWWNEPKRRKVENLIKEKYAYHPRWSSLIWLKRILYS